MKMLKVFLLAAAVAVASAPVASAAAGSEAITLAQPVIQALQNQGYTIVSIHTTWLNRVRIRAKNEYVLREIVVSPATGDILRDAIVRQLKPLPKSSPGSQTFIPLPPAPPAPAGGGK